MTLIRVNPTILSESAGKLNSVAENIRNAGRALWNGLDGAPFYDGQFSPRIRVMGLETQARAQVMALRMNSLSGSLSRRAAAFEVMDQAGALRFDNLGNVTLEVFGDPWYLRLLASWMRIPYPLLLRLISYGFIKSAPTDLPSGFVNPKGEGKGNQQKIVKQLMAFKNSEVGRKLAADAFAAGLLFVVMDGDQVVDKWGKEGGVSIPIRIGDMGKLNAYGVYDSEKNEITLNEDYVDDEALYSKTVPHEMQHAIDFSINLDHQALSASINSDMSVEQIEKLYADQLREVVKSEINAHDVGYQSSGNINDIFLNHEDGFYTKEEIDFIVYRRGYEEVYEDSINADLRKVFPENSDYSADVWVDELGQIHVDIDQSRNPILKKIDDLLDDMGWSA